MLNKNRTFFSLTLSLLLILCTGDCSARFDNDLLSKQIEILEDLNFSVPLCESLCDAAMIESPTRKREMKNAHDQGCRAGQIGGVVMTALAIFSSAALPVAIGGGLGAACMVACAENAVVAVNQKEKLRSSFYERARAQFGGGIYILLLASATSAASRVRQGIK